MAFKDASTVHLSCGVSCDALDFSISKHFLGVFLAQVSVVLRVRTFSSDGGHC